MKYRFLVLAVALIAIIMLAAVAPTLHAQSSSSSSTATSTSNDGDTPITVPKKYVSSEGLTHQVEPTAPAKVSEWVGIGKEIGEATKEGLDSVVSSADKFGATRVGIFVMAMIAWKVIGHQLFGVILGIPIFIAGMAFWWQVMKRLFFGYQVLDKKEGRTKTYKRQEPYDFNTGDARVMAGCFAWITMAAFTIVMIIIIFGS